MGNNKYGSFDSWEIINDDYARKTCDKSFFEYRGSGLPKEVRWFFDAEALSSGERKEIKLVFEEKTYDAYIKMETGGLGRTRIFWESALAEVFASYSKEIGTIFLEFYRNTGNHFDVSFNKQDSPIMRGHGKMKEVFNKFIDGFLDAKKEPFGNNPFCQFVRRDIPAVLSETGLIDNKKFLITGSSGAGNWAMIPWIAIFYKAITTRATKGVYIVYLLSKDAKRLYLTFNQGCTDLRNTHSKRETIKIMREKARVLQEQLDARGFLADEEINLGENLTELAELYQRGTIFYKEYLQGKVPEEAELQQDLSKMMEIYKEYISLWSSENQKITGEDVEDTWWPSLDEYDPGITKKQWLECLNDGSTFTANAHAAAADMYNYGGTATCKQLELKYGKVSDSYRTTLGVQLADKISKKLNVEPCKDENGKKSLWPILFQGRKAEKDESGAFVWKMRPELYDALTEYLSREKMKVEPSKAEAVTKIKAYALSQGFNCEKDLIENIYLSLRSKPFVILAGVSGTGKSWITRLFAEAIGAGDNYEMISVRPDWSDASELLGYVNLDGKFIPGMLTSVIKKATQPGNEDKIYFVCLDEMNLARVEYYFSDFLSVIETREWSGDRIVTRKIFKDNSFGPDIDGKYHNEYGTLIIPDNVYIIGTVNMDETTHPFSKKVLDRANTIELSEIDLRADTGKKTEEGDLGLKNPIALDNRFLRSKYLDFKACYVAHPEEMDLMIGILESINKALQPINAQVAYRVRNEIAYYLSYAVEDKLLSFEQAMDNALMQKILPRIQGEGHRIQKGLGGILDAIIPGRNFSKEEDLLLAIDNYLKTAGSDYPYRKSIKKISFMLEGIRNNGYATYWL